MLTQKVSTLYHITLFHLVGSKCLTMDNRGPLLLIAVKKTNLDISKCFVYEAVVVVLFSKSIKQLYEVICDFFTKKSH